MNVERLNYRNLIYNKRHRLYGSETAAMDIDFMEYNRKTGRPVALVETKFGLVNDVDLNDMQFTALCKLAEPLRLPVFLCIYFPLNEDDELIGVDREKEFAHIQFITMGVNQAGRDLLPRPNRMSEVQWASFLSELRGVPLLATGPLYDSWKPLAKIPQIIPRVR